MGTWNYRVIKHESVEDVAYSVHEVHYGDSGEVEGWTEAEVGPSGDTPSEMRESRSLYQTAFWRPVLVVRDGQAAGEEPPIQPSRHQSYQPNPPVRGARVRA